MFTLDQIKAAHSKVKSGADFPSYIQELIQFGIKSYTIKVMDGHAEYSGEGNYKIISPAKYEPLIIASTSDLEQFKTDLKRHQQGQTDYLTFCQDAANAGVEKWIVLMDKMTCTYYDRMGNEVLFEVIPYK